MKLVVIVLILLGFASKPTLFVLQMWRRDSVLVWPMRIESDRSPVAYWFFTAQQFAFAGAFWMAAAWAIWLLLSEHEAS